MKTELQILKDIGIGSKNAFLRRILKFYPTEPMMKQKEIRVFEEILRKLKPQEILEWGSGYSSLYFPQKIKKKFNWLAVEHNKEWYNIINKKNKNNYVQIKYIKPNNINWKKIKNDGTLKDYKDYIEYPKTLKKKFDLIIIDGRARKECFKVAKKILNKDGIIIIHDANRQEYYNTFKFKKNQTFKFLDDSINHGGIFLYNEKNIHEFISRKNHVDVWRKTNNIGRLPIIGKIILKIS